MIPALRTPHPSTAALLRLAAFLTIVASVCVAAAKVAAAATGRDSLADATTWAVAAIALVTATVAMSRSLDPLRRR